MGAESFDPLRKNIRLLRPGTKTVLIAAMKKSGICDSNPAFLHRQKSPAGLSLDGCNQKEE